MGDGLGWPVLQPVGRGSTWLGRIAASFYAVGGLWQIVEVALDGEARPPWRWVLIAVGATIALTASAWVWVAAGRVRRPVWESRDPFCPPPVRADYRAARTSLRTGAVLTDRQRRLVAYETGQLQFVSVFFVFFAAQFGYQVLDWSARTRPPSELVLVSLGLQMVALGALSVALWRARRLGDAAKRIGAVPHRQDVPQHER